MQTATMAVKREKNLIMLERRKDRTKPWPGNNNRGYGGLGRAELAYGRGIVTDQREIRRLEGECFIEAPCLTKSHFTMVRKEL